MSSEYTNSSVKRRWGVNKWKNRDRNINVVQKIFSFFWKEYAYITSNVFVSKTFKFILTFKSFPDLIKKKKNTSIYHVLWNSVNLILWLVYHFSLFSKTKAALLIVDYAVSESWLDFVLEWTLVDTFHMVLIKTKKRYILWQNSKDNREMLGC